MIWGTSQYDGESVYSGNITASLSFIGTHCLMETTPDFLHFSCFGFLGRLQPVWLRLSAGRVVTWICPNWWMDFLSNAFEFLGRLQPGWLRLIAGRDSTGNPCRRSFELFAASFPSKDRHHRHNHLCHHHHHHIMSITRNFVVQRNSQGIIQKTSCLHPFSIHKPVFEGLE